MMSVNTEIHNKKRTTYISIYFDILVLILKFLQFIEDILEEKEKFINPSLICYVSLSLV